MSESLEQLARRLVVGHKRDGRCVYDEQAKADLVAECARPGVSVSRIARQAGVNANQLSRWVRLHGDRQRAIAVAHEPAQTAFMPVTIQAACVAPSMPVPSMIAPSTPTLCVHARMPNGVVVDLSGCDLTQAGQLIEALGRMRCSASTKG